MKKMMMLALVMMLTLTGAALAEALKADCVAVIGRKVILYRRSSRKEFEHVEF